MGSVRHEDLLVVKRFLGSSTPHGEVFTRLRPQIASSHDLDQRLWASHLGTASVAGKRVVGGLPSGWKRRPACRWCGGGGIRPRVGRWARELRQEVSQLQD